MKYFLTLALALLPFVYYSQERVTLAFKTDDKPTLHGFPYWQEVRVTSQDTAFTTRIHRGNPDMIPNLKPGKYTLHFISLFNDCVSKKVNLRKKTALVKVKGLQRFYTAVADNETLPEKMSSKDTLYILFSTNSDENAKEKIAITKTKDGYKAIQYQGIGNTINQEMIFKDSFFKDVVKFERDGRAANSPKAESAPNAEMYTLELNRRIRCFIVPGDAGFSALKAKLFITEKK